MSKKVRFYYHYLAAVFRKQWRRLAIVVVLVVVTALGLGLVFPSINRSFASFTSKTVKPVFREGVVGQPATFNPLFPDWKQKRRSIA